MEPGSEISELGPDSAQDRSLVPHLVKMSHSLDPSKLASEYDALLIVGFGGPERRDDVLPFLENVLRGRPVPRERMLEVAEHYYHFGGVSPINQQVRDLILALRGELDRRGVTLPIYWGNRNWHPMLAETVQKMADDGIGHALGVVLSAYSSYSGCRQYREDILKAREGVGPKAPVIDKMRVFYNHPDFVEVNARKIVDALATWPEADRGKAHVTFTAHSIPSPMADRCDYERQLNETCRLVAEAARVNPAHWTLAYQSRSGRPTDPWLGPDILEHLADLKGRGVGRVVVQPVGFLSDHMEVLFDLDEEAATKAKELGVDFVRAGTAGTDPRFVEMFADLIQERIEGKAERAAIGEFPAGHDVCPVTCCLPTPRPESRPAAVAS